MSECEAVQLNVRRTEKAADLDGWYDFLAHLQQSNALQEYMKIL